MRFGICKWMTLFSLGTVLIIPLGSRAQSWNIPGIQSTPREGPPESWVQVKGWAFFPGYGVDIYFNQALVSDETPDGHYGIFDSQPFQIPGSLAPGRIYWIVARQESPAGLTAQAPFVIRIDWPQYRFGSTHDGNNPYETVISEYNVHDINSSWSRTGSGFTATPTLADGKVYVGSRDNNLYALDAWTGYTVWQYLAGGKIRSSPVAVAGAVYFGAADHVLYALNAASGQMLWMFDTGGAVNYSPAVGFFNDSLIYVASSSGNFYALNSRSGAALWSLRLRPSTSPAVAKYTSPAKTMVYVGSSDGNLYALTAGTGAWRWQFSTGGPIVSSPALANGAVYFGSTDGNLYAVNSVTGVKIWRYSAGAPIVSSVAVANGTVYVGLQDGNLYALSAATGAVLWRYQTAEPVVSSPALANGVVYFGSGGTLYALNAVTGALLWQSRGTSVAQPFDLSAVVVNGQILATFPNGDLQAWTK